MRHGCLLGTIWMLLLFTSHAALAKNVRDCGVLRPVGEQASEVRVTIAGVPAILKIPNVVTKPPIILWHGFGSPASKEALLQALPLDQVPATKVYLDLPLFGARLPPGGMTELARRQNSDFVTKIFEPAVVGAASELSSVVTALVQDHCMLASDRIGIFGFSAGGTAVFIALIKNRVNVGAAVTINASTGLFESVQAYEHVTKRQYHWTSTTRMLADETDATADAIRIAENPKPVALLLIHGKDDMTLDPAHTVEFYNVLLHYYTNAGAAERLDVKIVPDMKHDWVSSPNANDIRLSIADWFDRFL